MSTLTTPPRGRWTIHELVHMDPPRWMESCMVEVVDGCLVVTPPPQLGHERVGHRLFHQLVSQGAPGRTVMMQLDVLIGDEGDCRRPDVAVLRDESELAEDQEGVPAVHVVLAVEVESPSTRRTDRVAKAREYASVGIAAYWRVEREPQLCLVAHELVDGAYVETGRTSEGTVQLGEWWVDVSALST